MKTSKTKTLFTLASLLAITNLGAEIIKNPRLIPIDEGMRNNVKIEKGALLYLSKSVHEKVKHENKDGQKFFVVEFFCKTKNKNSVSDCSLIEVNPLKRETKSAEAIKTDKKKI